MTKTNDEFVREHASAAVRAFCQENKAYIPCEDNSRILTKEVVRLYHEENADPTSLWTYRQAFRNVADQLHLNELPEQKNPSQMTPEELSALSDTEKDRLSLPDLKRLAEWEMRQRRVRPEMSLEQQLLKQLFEDEGFAFSGRNTAVIAKWIDERHLACSEPNILSALDACEQHLEPSERALEQMSGDEYRKAVVEPEFRKRQALQPTRESRVPLGVSFTQWLHNS